MIKFQMKMRIINQEIAKTNRIPCGEIELLNLKNFQLKIEQIVNQIIKISKMSSNSWTLKFKKIFRPK